jgi:hypothetical protein
MGVRLAGIIGSYPQDLPELVEARSQVGFGRLVCSIGDYINSSDTAVQTLIVHWNGTAWKQVPSPNPSTTHSVLFGVTATSAANAWAIGEFNPFGSNAKILNGNKTLTLHCC